MNKIAERLIAYSLIILGAAFASFSVVCILIPNDAIDYGTAGIAIIISKLTGWNLSICVAAIFLPFWIMGAKVLGKQFAFRSMLGAVSYTVGLAVFDKIPFEINTEHFIAVAFGGAILGLGLAIILKFGGCIDGSEIFANILINRLSSKTGRNYNLTPVLLGFNALVYLAAFIFINSDAALMSLLVYAVATTVINNITDHFESIKKVTIITKDPDNIIKDIKEQMNKTCTVMDSYGAIAGENKTLVCYINYFELQELKEIISQSEGTFSTVSTIDEIL